MADSQDTTSPSSSQIKHNHRWIDLTGQIFGRLTVIRPEGLTSRNAQIWLTRCSCGNDVSVVSRALRSGNTQSCGCLHRERAGNASRTHGLSRTAEHKVWLGMKKRCFNPQSKAFPNYGARGITICERWLTFENFLADMGKRPSVAHSIERVDNEGNYEPANCRWATAREQCNNQRGNRRLTLHGKTATLAEWARDLGIHPDVLNSRLNKYGWTVEAALKPLTRRSKVTITYQGVTKPLTEWAREAGISASALRRRIEKLGWTMERAMTTPVVR